jgi:hypothetical protein
VTLFATDKTGLARTSSMNRITISSLQDLYTIKKVSQAYDEITIKLDKLKSDGLIRHAVKYSNYALRTGGLIIIYSSPFESYVLKRNKIDFWQVKYEIFGSLKDAIEILEVNSKEGVLVLRKKKHLYNYTGISFAIVFSGNKEEEKQLIRSIDSIRQNKGLNKINYEVLISGPKVYDPATIIDEFPGLNIKYVPLDISTHPRLMICEKKNFLYASARYSLVVISHSRILFSDDFVQSLTRFPVEMATPAVYFKDNDINYKYLDLAFIGSYQDLQLGAKRSTIAGENIQEDYLHWYRKRVPFIDGGLNVFNKNVIPEPPYNNYISWGEAEDVDLCNRLFQNGVLIDYLPAIKCYSATCKVTGYSSFKKIARKLFIYLNQKRIIH